MDNENKTVEVFGEQITEDQWKEMKAGNLRQSDYTKKTTEAAELAKTAKAQIEQVKPILEFIQLAQDDPEAAEGRMKDVLSDLRKAKKEGAPRAEIKALEQKVLSMEEANKQVAELTKQSATLRKSDPVFKRNEDEILEYAAKWTEKHGVVDLDEAYASWKGRNHAKLKEDDEPVLTGGRKMTHGTSAPEYDRSKSLAENVAIRRKWEEQKG